MPLARNSTAELLRKRLRESEEPTTAGARGLGAAAHTHSVLLDGLATTGLDWHCCNPTPRLPGAVYCRSLVFLRTASSEARILV